MNMKPHASGWIKGRSRFISCVDNMQGMVVQVEHLSHPGMNLGATIMQCLDGPIWRLRYPVRCAQCGTGHVLLPDSVLQPFDPESEPQDEEIPVGIVIEFDQGVGHG